MIGKLFQFSHSSPTLKQIIDVLQFWRISYKMKWFQFYIGYDMCFLTLYIHK